MVLSDWKADALATAQQSRPTLLSYRLDNIYFHIFLQLHKNPSTGKDLLRSPPTNSENNFVRCNPRSSKLHYPSRDVNAHVCKRIIIIIQMVQICLQWCKLMKCLKSEFGFIICGRKKFCRINPWILSFWSAAVQRSKQRHQISIARERVHWTWPVIG